MRIRLLLEHVVPIRCAHVPVATELKRPTERVQQREEDEEALAPLQPVDALVVAHALRHCRTAEDEGAECDGVDGGAAQAGEEGG